MAFTEFPECGSFQFLGVLPGSYDIGIALPFYILERQSIVMDDRDLSLDLQLTKP